MNYRIQLIVIRRLGGSVLIEHFQYDLFDVKGKKYCFEKSVREPLCVGTTCRVIAPSIDEKIYILA